VTIKNSGGFCVQAQFSQEHINLAHFQYPGESMLFFLTTLQSVERALTFSTVAVTDPSVTSILYPDGVHGLLGYGVDAGADAPINSTLLGQYMPYVARLVVHF
jgi:hypothetical protein